MITLKDVNFSYHNAQAQLRDISFSAGEGECVVLTGPSGCGKTTLTRMVNGLIPHFYEGTLSGEITICGKKAEDLRPWDFGKLIGSVFQDPRSQFFASIASDEIAFCCENYGIPPEEIRSRMAESVKMLEAESLLPRQLLTLSSGEKQKVAVASIHTARPMVYVMDEPSANLDMAAVEALAGILKRIKEAGHTLIIAEHRLYYLMDLADRVLYMQGGRIEGDYIPRQIHALPRKRMDEMGLRSPLVNGGTFSKPDHLVSRERFLGVRDLKLTAGKSRDVLLSDLSFDMSPGEIIALSGPNGIGKTTLARTLCGLAKEKSGRILYGGSAVRPSSRYHHAWFVMQDADCQLFAESVAEEMMVGSQPDEDRLKKAEQILRDLDLWAFREMHPASLSGGQKQRLTLAVALMQDTEILILDEPTAGLDGSNLARVTRCIVSEAGKGKTVLVITHDHELVQKACTRFLYLDNGGLADDFPLSTETYPDALRCMMRRRLMSRIKDSFRLIAKSKSGLHMPAALGL